MIVCVPILQLKSLRLAEFFNEQNLSAATLAKYCPYLSLGV